KRLARTTAVTLAWWVHGIVRLLLAIAMTYYGVAKLVFGQFGFADMGDALIAQGEMSPMGVLWRMVALSPLFQFLAGLAEFVAAHGPARCGARGRVDGARLRAEPGLRRPGQADLPDPADHVGAGAGPLDAAPGPGPPRPRRDPARPGPRADAVAPAREGHGHP